MINQELLKEFLHYQPETGIFTWKERSGKYFHNDGSCRWWNETHAGKEAGYLDPQGYIYIHIQSKPYLAHRLAWLYEHGRFPAEDTDHINGVKHNNWIKNIRSVSNTENRRNMKRNIRNTSGCLGVGRHKSTQKWKVTIGVSGKAVYLGLFEDWFEAVCARKSAEDKYGYHQNHGRIEK